jgi:hypothetical protein
VPMIAHRLPLAVAAVTIAAALVGPLAAQQQQSIFTDADAGVRGICRWDQSEAACLMPRGAPGPMREDWSYLRVHDQNNLDVAYLHFDLSGVAPNAQVTGARFQLDAQSNSWGNTSVMVVAIVDESEDWDLNAIPENEIYGGNAPKLDWSGWEDDPTPNTNRFNNPTPFLDEGSNKGDEVRQLVDEFEPVFIANTDPDTEGTVGDPGNSYGGYACCDGPGTAGSSDGADNPWPIKNAVDIDVTELIQWKLGQNAAYSNFTPSDRELTLMVRTEIPEFGGGNGFVRFVARESDYLGGDLDLQPGRLVLTLEGAGLLGDFNLNQVLDLPDIDDLTVQVAGGQNPPAYDLDGNSLVDEQDIRVWVKDLFKTWIGDADLNGMFESSDLVTVLASGTYEVDVDSVWSTGDFNGDRRTTSSDLVAALADGGYELGPLAATALVPEPSAIALSLLGLTALIARWHRRRR